MNKDQMPVASPKNASKKDPQAARARTFNMPKDFREELRKLQKQKK